MSKVTFLDNRDVIEITNKSASAITKTIMGREKSLSVSNVSPLAHKCSCKLTSDTYETSVISGKNIFDTSELLVGLQNNSEAPELNINIGTEGDGSFTVSGEIPPYDFLCLRTSIKNLTKNKQYTISIRDSKNTRYEFYLTRFDENDSVIREENVRTPYTFTYSEGDAYCDIFCYLSERTSGETIEETTYYVQIEENSEMTEWEPVTHAIVEKPYVEDFTTVKINVNDKSYTPLTDGTIDNILSISPTMEITTNNEHVSVCDFTYNVDTKSYVDNNIPEVDLSDYYTKNEINTALNDKQDCFTGMEGQFVQFDAFGKPVAANFVPINKEEINNLLFNI